MVENISPAVAAQWLATRAEVCLLDVRESWEWDAVKIEGARHVPMGQLLSAIHALPKSGPIVVLCHHGVRSYAAAVMLERSGFGEVYNVRGGIEAWAAEVDSALPRY
jgi:rhodanese-related sulfurtransferase